MALSIFGRCRDCGRLHRWETSEPDATEYGCGRWKTAQPPPTPAPSHGAGRCKGCGAHAALDGPGRCEDCRPVQQLEPASGDPTWGDALPADYLPPGVS